MTLRSNHGLHHRKEVERRQVARPTTTQVVTARPTATPVHTTAVKPSLLPPIIKPTVTRVITPVKSTVIPVLTSHASILPPSAIPSTLATTVSSVIVPTQLTTSSLPIFTISSTLTTTSTPLSPSITSVTSTSIVSTSSTVSSQPDASSGVSTGAVVGGIIGGFVALGFIGAALFLFLRRTREKKEDHAEAFDAAKFRRSAILLEDPAEKHSKPRPPTMIEQHVRNSPAPRSRQHSPPRGAPYGSHAHYNASYTGAYGAQAPYAQYPPLSDGYGYGGPHGYPPQPHYPPHPQYNTQQYGAYPPVPSPDSFASRQESLALPNPFDPTVETPAQAHYTPQTSDTTTTRNLTQTTPTDHDQAQVDDAPPAYEATSSSAGYKPDVKVKPSISVMNPGEPSKATVSISQASMSTVTPTSPSVLSSTPIVPSPTTATIDKVHSPRRLSGTSTITTVYDPQDAYGGM